MSLSASGEVRFVRTSVLNVAYEATGPAGGPPVILLHGFPYDPRAYDQVAPRLAAAGARVLVPYLRGYGPTSFLSAETPRSGQQAALGKDLLDFLDALHIAQAVLVGYDWGGRAACIVAALWPERVGGLVSVGGYNIQDIPGSVSPAPPETEHRLWYQYYFHSERGRAGLAANRRDLCRLLWRLWSPTWEFDDATYARSAVSFDNPDFVEVVIHSYRHRFGYAPGDPALEALEVQLARQPPIGVPTVALFGADDGVAPLPTTGASAARPSTDSSAPRPSTGTGAPLRSTDTSPAVTTAHVSARHFTSTYARRVVEGAGHNLPQERPASVVDAVLELLEDA